MRPRAGVHSDGHSVVRVVAVVIGMPVSRDPAEEVCFLSWGGRGTLGWKSGDGGLSGLEE